MEVYFVSYGAALLLSMALTVAAVRLGKKLGLTDAPGVRKVHREPIPCIGGVAICLSVFVVLLLVWPSLDATGPLFHQTQRRMLFLAAAATAVFLLGLADDVRPLRARLKLLVQLGAATLVYWGGIRIGALAVQQGPPVELGWLAWPLTVLWIVGITNAVNLSDGVDGLATSVSMIACGAIAALALGGDQTLPAVLMFAMLGALSGFLLFNFFPARIFLGDSGSLFLGFVIAASSVLCFMKSSALAVLALPAIALGIPILDTLLTIPRRFVARRPIFAADRSHFHHKLLQLGLGHRQVVGLICLSTLLVTGLGVPMLRADIATSLVLFGGITMLLLALFYAAGVVRFRTVIAGLRCRLRLGQQTREEMGEFCNLQLRFDQAKSPEAWWQALCCTAGQLEFAWISVDITDARGQAETHLWRRPETPSPTARMTIVKVPVQPAAPYASVEVEAAVLTNGSVEGAIRRASLLGRLVDEYGMPESHAGAPGLDPMVEGAILRAERSAPAPRPITPRLGSVADRSGPPADSARVSNVGARMVGGAGHAHGDVQGSSPSPNLPRIEKQVNGL